VDRFEILHFTEKIGPLDVPGEKLFQKIKKAQEFSKLFPNSRRPVMDILKSLSKMQVQSLDLESFASHRRKMAVLRVARTLADLDSSERIRNSHLKEAKNICLDSFSHLAHWN
jgi:hypothetical protein